MSISDSNIQLGLPTESCDDCSRVCEGVEHTKQDKNDTNTTQTVPFIDANNNETFEDRDINPEDLTNGTKRLSEIKCTAFRANQHLLPVIVPHVKQPRQQNHQIGSTYYNVLSPIPGSTVMNPFLYHQVSRCIQDDIECTSSDKYTTSDSKYDLLQPAQRDFKLYSQHAVVSFFLKFFFTSIYFSLPDYQTRLLDVQYYKYRTMGLSVKL